MALSRRIFFSMPRDDAVPDHYRKLHWAVAKRFEQRGYVVEVFARPRRQPGLSSSLNWTPRDFEQVARRCVGAVFIGTPRWSFQLPSGESANFASEYSQYEAGVIETLHLPRLVLREDSVAGRVVFSDNFGAYVLRIPVGVGPAWLDRNPPFEDVFDSFLGKVERRRDVFLGYCSAAADLASGVKQLLASMGATVLDWRDFAPAASIYDQIVEAGRRCTGGVFLFTPDDPLRGRKGQASPRDNVVFEAGYFAAAKGKERVLVIVERGAKLPADLGGDVYVLVEQPAELGPIVEPLTRFVEQRL